MYTNSMPAAPPESITPVVTRVLLVDDDALFLELCSWMLSRSRHTAYSVSTAKDMAQAEELCLTESFDCLLVDFRLPDGVGTQLIESLGQEMGRCTPASIVVTAEGGRMVSASADQAGADCCLTKTNMSSERLLNAIDSAVHRQRTAALMANQYEANQYEMSDHSCLKAGLISGNQHTIPAKQLSLASCPAQVSVSDNANDYISALIGMSGQESDADLIESALQSVLDDICIGIENRDRPRNDTSVNSSNASSNQAAESQFVQLPIVQAIAAIAPMAADKGVSINTSLDKNCHLRFESVERLREILQMLLQAMIWATGSGDRLLITVKRVQNQFLELLLTQVDSVNASIAKDSKCAQAQLPELFAASGQSWQKFDAGLQGLNASLVGQGQCAGKFDVMLRIDAGAATNQST